MQAEVAGLDGDDDFIAGAEGVEGDEADAGGAVDEAPLVIRADGFDGFAKAVFASDAAGEELLERRQLDVGGSEIEIGGDLPDDVGEARGFSVAVFDE